MDFEFQTFQTDPIAVPDHDEGEDECLQVGLAEPDPFPGFTGVSQEPRFDSPGKGAPDGARQVWAQVVVQGGCGWTFW